MRPWLSVTGTRCTRCGPPSCFMRVHTPSPLTRNVTSLSPPRSLGVGAEHLDLPALAGGVGRYISNRSLAKRLASSPPSAPRISTITLRPSLGSCGSSSSQLLVDARRSPPRRRRSRPQHARGRRRRRRSSISRAAAGVGLERPSAAGLIHDGLELAIARSTGQLVRAGRSAPDRRGAPRDRRVPSPGRQGVEQSDQSSDLRATRRMQPRSGQLRPAWPGNAMDRSVIGPASDEAPAEERPTAACVAGGTKWIDQSSVIRVVRG